MILSRAENDREKKSKSENVARIMLGIIGKKVDQTQKFLDDGTRIPVTIVAVSDNIVTQVKTAEKESYSAIQVGIGKKKHPSKPLIGHVKKANLQHVPFFTREWRMTTDETMPSVGDILQIQEMLKPGDIVQVTGISKGKGFAGVVKRHGFKGGPRTHGQSDRERAPGSIGQTTTPGRVYRGKRMAGRMGQDRVTVKNLKVVVVDTENHQILISGVIPGPRDSYVWIEKTGELSEKKYKPLFNPNPDMPQKPKETETPVEAAASNAVSDTPNKDVTSNVTVEEDKEDAK
ncbi:MAG TPA: 50S ribosomal protein L3 [Patescibacteria group bacterium]|nr:50S ribosomal protein L3 [Patescibacteria group bacterium]